VETGQVRLTADLFDAEPLVGWRKLVLLWKSQLESDDWDATIQTFAVETNDTAVGTAIILSFEIDHEDVSVTAFKSPARADAVRTLLEARLTLDRSLEASSALWVGVLEQMMQGRFSGHTELMLIAQGLNFALGSEFAPEVKWSEFLGKL